ncbi:MAG: AtpZ/AtpI family protein [Burkholderiaceae bacterium]
MPRGDRRRRPRFAAGARRGGPARRAGRGAAGAHAGNAPACPRDPAPDARTVGRRRHARPRTGERTVSEPPQTDRTEDAARRAHARDQAGRADPEPSLARRLGQIGVLGWIIVIPTLGGVLIGHWLDARLGTGIMLAAALLMAGAVLGLWLAMRWMHDQ